jgi:hypothetical protein
MRWPNFFMIISAVLMYDHTTAQTHEAHTHGEATLSVVLEGDQLYMELKTPAANLLGFEHAPHNEDEMRQLKQAMSILREPNQLFLLSPQCNLKDKDVDSPFADDEHNHAKEHKDVILTYQWQCPNTKELSIKVNLFKAFLGFEKVHAEWIAFNKQDFSVLDKNNSFLVIAP